MRLESQDTRQIGTRLRRAHGHLARVIAMLDEGAECEDVLTQLAAVHKAVGRSAYALVTTGLVQCIREADGAENVDAQRLEKLFGSFA